MTTPKLTETITLTVPAEEGGDTDRKSHSSLTMRRPRARHVKRVVALLGPDFVRNLMATAEGEAMARAVADKDTIAEALALLTDPQRLDGLTEILADLCGVSPAVIDDLDPVDLFKAGQAMFGFFPDLGTAFSS
ncbi:phage tail assembly protein [Stappia sp.]|uniref:phage tail assembly protein n=1 Tax=Stappia sp. TaxID=1870903 RepID=UPI003A9999E2